MRLEHQDRMGQWTTISTLDQPRGYLASREVRQLQDPRLAEYTHCLKVVREEPQLLFGNVGRVLNLCIREALSEDIQSFVK